MFCALLYVWLGVFSSLAYAKGDEGAGTVQMTGIASFDAVFQKVDDIDRRLDAARYSLSVAKRSLEQDLGVEPTTIQDELLVLKSRAAGRLTVTLVGGRPRVTANGAVPPDVTAAIDTVNDLAGAITSTIDELRGIPADAAGLATAVAALPKQLKTEAKAAGLQPTQIPAKLKIVKQNVAIAADLPDRAVQVVDRMGALLSAIAALAS